MAIESPFVWGKSGTKLTPEELEKRREVEEALLAKGVDTSPVGDWTQGLARVANAAAGSFRRGRLERAGEDIADTNKGLIANLLSGNLSSTASPAIPTTSATSPAPSAGDPSYRDAIASIESAGSGDYSAVGPTHPKMGQALGRYQIMEANLAPWGQEALGRPVSKEEFLSNPQIQDALFDAKFGSYVSKFGPEGAAQAWFAGPGGVGKTERKDVLGTDVNSYGKKFLSALGGSQAPVQVASLDPSAGMGGAVANSPSMIPAPGATPYNGPGARTGEPMLVYDDQGMRLEPQQQGVGVGGVPAGSGGQPVLDVTQMPQLSSAAGLSFQGAPQQANPVAQALIQSGQGQLSPQGMAAHDKALGGILAPTGAPQPSGAALGGYFPPAPDANRPEFAPQSQGINPAIIEALTSPQATPQTQRMAALLLEQQQKANDPANQLDMRYKQAQIDALTNKAPEAPKIETLYDENGNEYKARWNPTTQQYDRLGGSKTGLLTPEELQQKKDLAAAGATNVTVGGEPADGALRKKLDEKTGELWSSYQSTGATSASMAQDFQVLDELMKTAPQGPIQGRLAEMFPGISSSGAAFQSIVKRIAPTLRAPGSGATSDIEYDGMLKSLPALTNKPEANQIIGGIMKAKAQINIERSGVIDAYGRGEITAGEARTQIAEIDKRSIMTPEMKQLIGAGSGQDDGGLVPEGVDPGDWKFMTPEERKLFQ